MSNHDGATDRPVTFSEIFRFGEFRAIFASTQLAELGDHLSKAAVTALVFIVTESVALSAAAFAVSFLPWAVGGPFLSALAERLRYRTVMATCDALRAVTIGLIVLVALTLLPSTTDASTEGVPPAIWLVMFLLFVETLLAPPALSARSAIMPLVLEGERVTLGLAVNSTGRQAFQVTGYMAGALLAIIDPALALSIDALLYVVSALVVRFGVRDRAPAMRAEQRSHLLRETREGFQIVFGHPMLRAIATVVFAAMLFSIVPEGLAISWAEDLAADNPTRRGLYQGLIMVANPIAHVIAALLIVRLLRPRVRSRMVPFLLVLAPLALVPSLTQPSIAGVVAMTMMSGLAIAALLPSLNGMFVQILRHGYRARAFGVMNSGMQVIQGGAVLIVGALVGTGWLPLPVVVGLWCAAGVVLMMLLASRWPKPDAFTDAIAEAREANEVAVAAAEAEAAAKAGAGAGAAGQPDDTTEQPGPGQVQPGDPAESGKSARPESETRAPRGHSHAAEQSTS